jgi:serine/threonine protein kinase
VSSKKCPSLVSHQILADRYRIRRFLALGGMGEVYEADDLELGDRVALKTIRPELAGDRLSLERFRREIMLQRKITHPNVCRIFDLGRHVDSDGVEVAFLTMELLEGETLAERLYRDNKLSVQEAFPLVSQIASALGALHRAGIVHRDLKSENVVLVPALEEAGGFRAVLTDFGLARATRGSGFAMTSGAHGLVGTPGYMSPEQVMSQPIGPPTDLYAFGVVMFEMVTGRLPFAGGSAMEVAARRLKHAPPSPRSYTPSLPIAWERAILRCLERDPAARFGSATEAVVALGDRRRARGLGRLWALFVALFLISASAAALHATRSDASAAIGAATGSPP